jgi:hypothetical protein
MSNLNKSFLSVVQAISNGPARELGENSHPQFNVEGATKPRVDLTTGEQNDSTVIVQEIKNKLVALNFLLVRGVDVARINKGIEDIVQLLEKLPSDGINKNELTVKLLILAAYQRDIENGKGERDLFYNMIFKLWQYYPHAVEVVLHTILPTDHACWKDILLMIEKLKENHKNQKWAMELEESLFHIYATALKNDYAALKNNQNPSLACKWAPRQQTHFDNKFGLAKSFAKVIFPEIDNIASRMKAYRKFLSASTEAAKTIESLMCSNQWEKINPGAIPSKAMKNYRLVLQNQTKNGKQRSTDPKRVALSQKLIQFLVSGKKVHGKTLMVHEIITQLLKGPDTVLEAQLQSIVDDFCAVFPQEIGLILPLADVSGSMEVALPGSKSRVLDVSIALAFLLSQVNGPFKNKVMTFHSDPRIFDLKGDTLYQKIMEIKKMPWGGSTDFGKAMDYLLRSLKENGIPGKDVQALSLIVFSDMQFDQANGSVGYYNNTAFDKWTVAQERIEKMYKNENYPTPRIIYWNLNARTSSGLPAHTQEENIVLLSGFSQSALKTFLKGDILPTIEEQDQALDPEQKTKQPQKNPWDVLEKSFENYVWLMQAFEKSNLFPGYKAPIIEEEKKEEKKEENDGWEHVD